MRILALLVALFLSLPALADEVRYPSRTLEVDGRTWKYYVSESSQMNGTAVVLLHGAGGSGGGYLAHTGFGELARAQHFLCVAPDAFPRDASKAPDFATNPRIWKDEDEKFLEALQKDMRSRWHVTRVFVVGHSNGGTMALEAARRHPARWAGVAAVGALPPLDVTALNARIPTLVMMGDQDRVIPFAGGEGQTPWGRRAFPSLREAFSKWAQALGYAPDRPTWIAEGDRVWRWTVGPDCQALKIGDQGHSWPGWTGTVLDLFAPCRPDYNATQAVWTFFSTM